MLGGGGTVYQDVEAVDAGEERQVKERVGRIGVGGGVQVLEQWIEGDKGGGGGARC